MNKQIKALLIDAWEKAEGPSVKTYNGIELEDMREELMKDMDNVFTQFAESIIRECAKIADLADESNCECVGANVLMRFGVEE